MAYELFMDGFDYYDTADITKKWQSNSASYGYATYTIAPTSGRRGGGALQLTRDTWPCEMVSKTFPVSTHVVFGFAVKLAALSYPLIIYFKRAGNNECQFNFQLSGQIHFQRSYGDTGVYSESSLSFGVWNYVELGVNFGDDGAIEVRVNGSSVGYFPNTSYDTKLNTSSTGIDAFGIYQGSSSSYIDDLYYSYGDELKFLGDSRVDTLALTANSTPQDWTPDTGNAWERLNQDAGYISSDTVDAVSLFNAEDITHNPSLIHGIQINGHAYKSDAGYREAALVLKSGATTDVGTPLALSTDPLLIREPYIVDPNTGAAFTKANLNAIEVGAKVTA